MIHRNEMHTSCSGVASFIWSDQQDAALRSTFPSEFHPFAVAQKPWVFSPRSPYRLKTECRPESFATGHRDTIDLKQSSQDPAHMDTTRTADSHRRPSRSTEELFPGHSRSYRSLSYLLRLDQARCVQFQTSEMQGRGDGGRTTCVSRV
jgi:hypothetical protein